MRLNINLMANRNGYTADWPKRPVGLDVDDFEVSVAVSMGYQVISGNA